MMEIGFLKQSPKVSEKEQLLKTLKLHFTVYKSLPELEQMKQGLSVLGVQDAMKKHKDLFKPLFTACNSVLTAG